MNILRIIIIIIGIIAFIVAVIYFLLSANEKNTNDKINFALISLWNLICSFVILNNTI